MIDGVAHIISLVKEFVSQANNSNDLKYGKYKASIKFNDVDLVTKASFGQGTKAKVPWYSIMKPGQTTSNGYYPVYLLDLEAKILVLAYGISEEFKPLASWDKSITADKIQIKNTKNITNIISKYPNSYVFREYLLDENFKVKSTDKELVNDLEQILVSYVDNVALKINEKDKLIIEKIKEVEILDNKKQIILYGPAGTGKTYNTKNIIVNHAFDNVDSIDKKYKELQDQGRVQFVTFHQSFAYEDFIEGIKPNLNEEVEGNISYKVENGIFKELCEKAKENYINSFKSTQQVNHEQQIKQKFISFVNDSIENEREFSKTQKNKTFTIISIDSQSLVINSDDSKYNNHRIEIKLNDFYTALGYEEREKLSTSKEYALKIFKRTTQWQVDTYILNILKEFDKESKNFKDIIETKEDNKLRNYYLIIDEINRGNISKIFGELITLLESSKRLGEADELTTTLPYSKDEFGIPPNLYIIGTMNTSDKSIAHLDIALRRRFGFVEMLPSYDEKIIKNEKCRILLKNLNDRIEILLDKDHLIGHSFFCGISENESNLDNKISTIMQNEIVPLLEEYFYGDYEKIQLVLGSKNLNSEKFKKHKKYKDITNIKKLLENSDKETKYEYWFEEENPDGFDISLGDVNESETKDD
ncbi:MrcB family domain-containing protein [Francisella philomiragia]